MGLGGRATGGAIPSLRGKSGIVVSARTCFGAGFGGIEGIEKVAACLRGCCQCMNCREKCK